MKKKISENIQLIKDLYKSDNPIEGKSAFNKDFFQKNIFPICLLAFILSFLLLLISNNWYIAVIKAIINSSSIPAGMIITFLITSIYITDSPLKSKTGDYISQIVFRSVMKIILPLSAFYAIKDYSIRYVILAATAIYFWKILKKYINGAIQTDEKIRNNTFILIYASSIIFPYIVQRILYLIFNIPF